MSDGKPIVVLGVFVADTTYHAERQPKIGETILGNAFTLGPGGKGSNQAVAAGRLGADVSLITRLGEDAFAELAKTTWRDARVKPFVTPDPESYTGAAFIFVEKGSGDNAIIISPGAAGRISPEDVEANAERIRSAGIFVTQLEQPLPAATRALEIAREARVTTILNPAPATPLDDAMLALCDYVTPNESEAEALTGLPVHSPEEAEKAARVFLAKGVGAAIVTLGAAGCLYVSRERTERIPAMPAGDVVETTGAGDAFNAGFATALARGEDPVAAVRFGCAVAGISVTRAGAASSMPRLEEVEALLRG
ncbi:ribokinase [Pararhizobium mangrovi]|uniref:Ribokinase n=1 Tax=Pararhizobium mangrovi TaxID=2590452 RepID=A0A506U665_9HYPH|nr:ribokinase [Pararhizobium mangrovi]TPW29882.1 ribokinase [Pararhizobium mangrovi]